MGKIITNRELVAAPPTTPIHYGLFTAVSSVQPMDAHLIAAGGQHFADHCGDGQLYDQTCISNPAKTFVEGSDLMPFNPFWTVARKRCGAVGRTGAEMQAAVRQQLLTSQQTLVESGLWGGTVVPVDPNLTGNAGTTVVVPAAAGFGAAIAALEEAFYSVYGYTGTIHVNMSAYGAAAYSQLIVRQGGAGVLRTPMNSAWSFGAGYGITGPAGVAPAAGFVWAFMTGAVNMWRSGILPQAAPTQTLDRTLNQWDVVAEEVFGLTWDCPDVFAVQVPLAAPAVATAPAPV
jgi:hypothetical protein